MSLRTKVLLIFTGIWIIVSLIIYLDSQYTLVDNFKQLETKQVVQEVDHLKNSIRQMEDSLAVLNKDWSRWDDAYDFMLNKNQKFIQTNLVATTYENAKINFIIFLDTTGKIFFGQQYDLAKKSFSSLPNSLIILLETTPAFSQHSQLSSSHVGILQIPEGKIVMSSLPILTSEGKGPIRGTLLMGFYLTPTHFQNLSKEFGMKIDFFPLPLNQNNMVIKTAYKTLLEKNYFIMQKNNNFIYGFSLLKDINQQPVGIMQIEIDRSILQEGMATINRYLLIVLLIGILVLATVWFLIKVLVLDRVLSVSKQVIDIKSTDDFSKRLQISGKDELNNMVQAMNSLLEIIELTQEQLKYRLLQHTDKLGRLSELNKNLFTEITQQKAIDSKLREEEKSLRKLAYYDALTGLPNRFFFQELLKKMLEKAEKEKTGVAVLFLDVDKFKQINDTYGHDVGDRYLRHVAHQIKLAVSEHLAGRIAGDEFIVAIENVKNHDEITAYATKILQFVSTPLVINKQNIRATASIGISIYQQDGNTADELKKQADVAMYYAKRNAGNTYCYFETTLEKESS